MSEQSERIGRALDAILADDSAPRSSGCSDVSQTLKCVPVGESDAPSTDSGQALPEYPPRSISATGARASSSTSLASWLVSRHTRPNPNRSTMA